MEPLIVCDDVCKTLRTGAGKSRTTTAVFSGLNLRVGAGERLGIVGPSGSGKTTLLQLINRLADVDSGRVLVDGADVREWEVLSLRRTAQLVPQKPFLFGETIRDNLAYGLRAAGRDVPDECGLETILERVALAGLSLERPVKALSVGQQQRVCLARALALGPRVLMLDETTASLEPPAAKEVLEGIYRLSERDGLTLLHVTHEVAKLRALDRLVVLAGGVVAEEGPPERLLARPQAAATREFGGGLA